MRKRKGKLAAELVENVSNQKKGADVQIVTVHKNIELKNKIRTTSGQAELHQSQRIAPKQEHSISLAKSKREVVK